jgi:hypothetical protein
VHHTEHHRAPATHLWQGLIYLSTAVLGLVLYRLADLPLVVAILSGFAATVALIGIGYLSHHSKP